MTTLTYNPDTAVTLTPGTRLGPYEIVSTLGVGPSARVRVER